MISPWENFTNHSTNPGERTVNPQNSNRAVKSSHLSLLGSFLAVPCVYIYVYIYICIYINICIYIYIYISQMDLNMGNSLVWPLGRCLMGECLSWLSKLWVPSFMSDLWEYSHFLAMINPWIYSERSYQLFFMVRNGHGKHGHSSIHSSNINSHMVFFHWFMTDKNHPCFF